MKEILAHAKEDFTLYFLIAVPILLAIISDTLREMKNRLVRRKQNTIAIVCDDIGIYHVRINDRAISETATMDINKVKESYAIIYQTITGNRLMNYNTILEKKA